MRLRPCFERIEPIVVAYLFGSVVREQVFRDIDIAVLCRRGYLGTPGALLQPLRWGTLAEQCLQPRKDLDLRVLNEAPVTFQHEVISTGVIIFERDRDARVLFEAWVLSAYLDEKPLRDLMNAYLLEERR